MKKSIIFSAAAALTIIASCGTPAAVSTIGQPSAALTGIWVRQHETNDKNGKSEFYDRFAFFADGTFAQYGYIKMDMSKSISPAYVEILYQGAGKYGVEGDHINLDFTPSNGTAKLCRYDVSTDKSLSAGRAGATKFFLKSILIKPMIQDLRKSMKTAKIYTIDSIDSSALEITDTQAVEPKSEKYFKQNGNQ